MSRGKVEVYLYSFFNLGGKSGCVVNATPRPLYPRERPGEGWVDPSAGLDGCGKSRLHRDLIPGYGNLYGWKFYKRPKVLNVLNGVEPNLIIFDFMAKETNPRDRVLMFQVGLENVRLLSINRGDTQ
jgi:hypothetical protein